MKRKLNTNHARGLMAATWEFQRQLVRQTLESAGSLEKAAERLAVSRESMTGLLQRLDIDYAVKVTRFMQIRLRRA